VRAVFSWSYRHLDAGAGRAFRLAGLHPGPDLDRHAAAALLGTTPARAGRLLDVLAAGTWSSPPGRAGTPCMTCCAAMPANWRAATTAGTGGTVR
jgi:hypothetical protein